MDDRLLLSQSIKFRKEKRYEDARGILLSLVTDSNNPEVFYQCACVHDNMGLESEAVYFYEKAIQLGLQDEDLRGAYTGLGSTYRCLGEYEKALAVLQNGLIHFPNDEAMSVFLAMTQFNLQNHETAIRILLEVLLKTSNSALIQKYSNAIEFYSDKLNQTWR